ncbi:MAG TPA: hypothetical protein VGR71_05820, partial [Nitrospira sp.]|nr:hypothetical protein [Nitrospira sp.]
MINAKVEGGERGRLLWYARHIFETPLRDRISFFADADGDRILGVLPPGNVTFTDGRDLESYALTEPCLIRLCLQGFGASEPEASRLLPVVISVARPIGVLRILSAAGELRLPFRRTFERNGLRRFLDGKKFEALLDVVRLVSTLMQNAKIPLSKKDLML